MTDELVPGTTGLIAVYETKDKQEGQMPVVGFFKESDGAGGFTYTAAVINHKGKAVKINELKNWKRLDWETETVSVKTREAGVKIEDDSLFGRVFGSSWGR
jgi:hypothetical protein